MGVRTNSYFIFSLLFLFFTFNLPIISHGSDTISANQSLSGDQTLVSANGTFKLGFYNQPGNSSNYYICIVYNKVSLRTIAWIANRDKPISDKNSAVLKIMDGNLVLLNESQIIWSTYQNSAASSSVVAVLGDDGNLVVKDGFNSTQPIWQSFDFPTNTWLPGGKIAYNKRTKTHQNLTSWKNSEDPSRGLFSLSLIAETKEYVISWNGSEQYWTGGSWNGQIFTLVPEMSQNYIYNFTYVDNENESYFTYSLYNKTIISRFVMDVSGQITQQTWLETTGQWNLFWSKPREQCKVYAFCGHLGLAIRLHCPSCGNTSVANQESTDKFYEYPNMGLPNNSLSVASSSTTGCASSCLNNCNCTAYSYDNNGCSIWIGELVNLQLSPNDGTGRTLYLRLAASEFSKGKENKGIIIGAVAGSVAVVLLLGLVFIIIWKRQRRFVGKTKMEGSLIAFGYRDLQIATKNFSEKLGGGGFGSVFKGTLPDSTTIAVKKLESISQGEKQFRMEVSTIGIIQHVNLVRLQGFCSDVEGGDLFSLLDHRLEKNADEEELRRIARVACWCIQDDENHRPTMGQVVQILEGVLEVNPPRVPRSLQAFVENPEHIVFFTDLSSGQSSQPQSADHSTASIRASSTSSTMISKS
ncbi:hypothetical protein RHGRI_010033 [Rhododendron griersonianum]|uniref:non-specific serine/threonine protein kinase n=1 Tax=Rhododendron griersonianum TaxID=479676 RepID=A0AAV6KHL8_9ERIC|nr:hypothetical protein RHGRI_010033 [Rhododendron griersonianum]